jgi:hypothetical protein
MKNNKLTFNQVHVKNNTGKSPECKQPLMVYHQNIRSIRGKTDELLSMWNGAYPHVLCFSEHHMRNQEISMLCCSPYRLAAKYCRSTSKSGGVCIYAHASLSFTTINLDKYCREQEFEVCAIKLYATNVQYCILSIYRSPAGKISYFISALDIVLKKLHSTSRTIILCGDFNINYLSNSNNKIQLDSVLITYSLYNIVDFPTRIGNNSATAIDGIFIDKNKISNYAIMPIVNGLSDHDAQLLLVYNSPTQIQKGQYYIKRQINGRNIENLKFKLSFEAWDDVFTEGDVDKLFNSFLNTYLRIYNSCFPYQKITCSYDNKAWLTAGIRNSCQHKRHLFLLCRSIKSPTLLAYYKKYTEILRAVMKKAKRIYYNKLIINSDDKTKTIWKIVNKEASKYNNNNNNKNHDHPLLIKDRKRISNGLQIANAFNVHFTTIMDKLPYGPHTNAGAYDNRDKFFQYLTRVNLGPISQIKNVPVTSKEIKDIMKSIKNKNSFGYDEISSRVLKLSMPFIIAPLVHLCNRSLLTGIFPSRLKYSQVYPIFKKGEKTDISNYRPISLLTSFSKIFEKVIFNRLHTHVTVNNLLNSDQYGFRKRCSTETATFNLINNILQALDDKKMVSGIFCDLSKAFDSVEHKTLLEKLKFYGIQGIFLKLIASYLDKRYQRIVIQKKSIGNWVSNWAHIKRGVPQGSILGPLFFLLYINDLPAVISSMSKPTLFADDINLTVIAPDSTQLKSHLVTVFGKIMDWFQANSLTLNLSKTHFIYFKTKMIQPALSTLKFKDKQINSADCTDFLGVTLDSVLSWQGQITKVITKLNSACYAIRTLKSILTIEDLKMVYFAYAHTIIMYGLPFWGNAVDSGNVFIAQKRIIRVIFNVGPKQSCRELFRRLNILPFYSQYMYSLLLLVAKSASKFVINNEIYTINTRHSTNLHVPSVNLTKCKKGPYYMGIKLFNHLPEDIRKLLYDFNKFKVVTKTFFLKESFYSINEYYNWTD